MSVSFLRHRERVMRLFGLTMVRDEADVIDAYVRHNLTVLDIIGRSFVPQQTQYVISGNHLVDDPASLNRRRRLLRQGTG